MKTSSRISFKWTPLGVSFAAALMILSSLPASAQQTRCAERELVVNRLESSYGETRQSIGLSRQNGMLEVYASSSTGTWTIIVTNANGLTCMVASGQAFETLAEVKQAAGDDA